MSRRLGPLTVPSSLPPWVLSCTRHDAREFLALAAEIPLTTHVHEYALADANQALDDLRAGRLSGAAVLVP
jgi:propanol-preferring alcohol dehydrogenase